MKLRNKLIITFVLLNVISSMVLIVVISYQFTNHITNELYNEQKENAKIKIEKIQALLVTTYTKRTLLINSLPSIDRFVNTEISSVLEDEKERIQDYFIQAAKIDSRILQIRLLDESGMEKIRINSYDQINVVPDNELQNKSDREYFKQTMVLDKDQAYISNIELNVENNVIETPHKITVRFSTPIFDELGNRQGILVINVDISTELNKLSETTRGSVILLDEKGDLKIHKDTNKLFGLQLNTEHNYFSEQPELYENLKHYESLLYHDVDEREFRYWEKIHYNSQDPEKYWVLLTVTSEDELYAPLYSLQYLTLIISAIVIVIAIVTTFLFSSKIARRITRLSKVTALISQGYFDEKIKAERGDEIGDLAFSFKHMQESLKQYRSSINEINIDLKLKIEELKKADMLKDEFSSMVTHELKTPLTPIKGYCEMLEEKDLLGKMTDAQKNAVKEISRNAVRLERLISDVLDAQKLGMRNMSFQKTSFSTNAFLLSAHKDLEPLMKEKQIRFELLDNLDYIINTDEERLRQVLDNIVRNAVDFVNPNSGLIEVGVEEKEEYVIFHVQDNGIGIPLDKQKHLFTKFYQIDTSATRHHGGTGLGLVICKGIIEQLGGKIWIKSEEGKGTTVYFSVLKMPKSD